MSRPVLKWREDDIQSWFGIYNFLFLISLVNAGEIGAKLTSQIELLPSCSVNNNVVENNAANLNFGTIDFGEATTAFKGF